jgi:hypothetical protein
MVARMTGHPPYDPDYDYTVPMSNWINDEHLGHLEDWEPAYLTHEGTVYRRKRKVEEAVAHLVSKKKPLVYCSFCGKNQDEVETLIAGPASFICNECAELSMKIINERRSSAAESPTGTDPIERAAKAAYESAGASTISWEKTAAWRRKMWREAFLAGLRELREPSEAMIEAGDDICPTAPVPEAYWRAMIDVLLGEKP